MLAALRPMSSTQRRSARTTPQSAHRAKLLHLTATSPAAESNTFPPQSLRLEKSRRACIRAVRGCPAPSPRAASSRIPLHRQTQKKNPAPPPDIFPLAQIGPSAIRSGAAAPGRSPPEKHPAAASARPSRPRQAARTAPPQPHPSARVPIAPDENTRMSRGRNSARETQTPPANSPHHL